MRANRLILASRMRAALLVAAALLWCGTRDAVAQFTWASDNGGNYGGGWSNGSDGGFGYGAWGFSQGAGTGGFIGSPANDGMGTAGIGTTAFGLYSIGTNYFNANRSFDSSMQVGDSLTFYWAMNWDTNSPTGNKGFDLRSAGSTIFNVNNGNTSTITTSSGTANTAYGTTPMLVTLSRASAGEYAFSMTSRSGGPAYATTISSSSAIDGIGLYIGGQGGGEGNRNIYFNNFNLFSSGTYAMGGTRVETRNLTGGGSLTVGGSTTLVLTGGGNTFTGGSAIQAGSTLQVGDGVSGGSLSGNVANAGTVVFDAGGPVTFGGSISGAGGLVKQGPGTVTFTGVNTYDGPTTISGGQLTMTTSSTLGGGITVASGATLGVTLTGVGATLAAPALTLGSLSNLTIDLSTFGSGTAAPLNILGAVTTSGASTINFTTSAFSVGTIPLIRYGSLSSFSDFVIGEKPTGVQASLFNNTATNTLELLIERTPRFWSGDVSGTPNGAWAVGSPVNWTYLSGTTVTPTPFADGDAVIFNDAAAGTTAVTLAGAVSPSTTTIDNTTKAYSFSGAGGIGGTGGLVKLGSGTVTMSTLNTYTGTTTIGGGRLEVATLSNGGAASPLGSSSAAPDNLVLTGGTLAITGAGAQATDRGFTVGAAGGGLEITFASATATFSGDVAASGAFRKSGAGTLALTGTANTLGTAGAFAAVAVEGGRLALLGGGSTATSQINTVTGEMWVGTVPGGAALEVTNSTLAVSSWLSLDSGTASSLTNSAASVGNLRIGYDGGATPSPSARLALLDSTLASAGETIVGNSGGSTGSLSLAGNSRLTSLGPVLLANGSSSAGSMVVAGASVLTGSSYMAVGNFGNGTLTVRDTAAVSVAGDLNIADLAGSSGSLVIEGGTVSAGQFYAGKNGPSTGNVTVSGGSLSSAGDMTFGWKASSTGNMTLAEGSVATAGNLTIGADGASTWTQTGGTASAGGTIFLLSGTTPGVQANVTVSGGLLAQTGSTGALVVGQGGEGYLTVSSSGRVAVAGAGGLVLTGGSNGFALVTVDTGGTLEVTRITRGAGAAGSAILSFDNATLKAAADANPNFMDGLDSATLFPGGVTIDTSGQNLSIAQPLVDYGGGDAPLTKAGVGMLTLTGVNTYGGLTTVSAGGLTIETSSGATGGYQLGDGTVFGINRVGSAASQAAAASFTMSGSATLNFDFGTFGSQPAPLLGVAGSLSAAGDVIVNVSNVTPLLGQFPLLAFGSKDGVGTYSLGSATPGITASIVTSSSNTLDLLVSAISGRFWNGQVSGTSNGDWNVGTTANWLIPPSAATTFADGDEAVFNDSAAGTTAVTLAAGVSPSMTTIDNTTKNYSFTGAGGIAGSGSLLKLGSGTATMSTANTYTGTTTIGGGRFEVATLADGGVASPLGAASAAAGNLVISGGTLAITGAGATATDRGFTVGAAGGGLEVTQAGGTATFSGDVAAAGAFRKTGAGTLALTGTSNALGTAGSFAALAVDGGRLSLAGSGSTAASQINTVTGQAWVGGASGGTLAMANSSLDVTGDTIVGNSAGATGAVSLEGNSRLTSAGPVLLANGSSSAGSMVVAGSSVLTGSNYMSVGNLGSGTLTVRDTASVSVPGDLNIADLAGSSGALLIEGGTVTAGQFYAGKNGPSTGNVTVSGGSLSSTGDMTFGWKASSTGNMTLSAGSLAAAGNLTVGGAGLSTWTQTGGTATSVGTVFFAREGIASRANVTVSAGLLGQTGSTGALVVGEQGEGYLTIAGSGRVLAAGDGGIVLSGGTTGLGDVALDGGTLEVSRVQRGSGFGYLKLNGGTLKAAANANPSFMSGLDIAEVQAGGSFIDSNGQTIGIAQVLTGPGGITKIGEGTLRLTGASTYAGPTTVSAGTLLVNGDQSGATGPVTVASGATLGGIGTVGGDTTIESGATLTPGASPGTLTFAQGLTLAAGGNYNWQILNASGTAGDTNGWDLVSVGGALNVASTSADPFKINLWSLSSTAPDVNGNALNFDASQGFTWKIASATGGITGFDADKFQIITGATNGTGGFTNAFTGTFSLALSGSTDLNLVYSAGAPSVITINVPSGTETQTAAGHPLLAGTTPVEKIGLGTVVFDQANTLTGPTTVTQGTLELATANALSSSAVTVAAGATLAMGPQVSAAVPTLVNDGLVDVGFGELTVVSGLTAEGLKAEIVAGRNEGAWDGATGITSSGAAGTADRAVGWIDNGDGSFRFGFAAAGDLDMNGLVDLDDVIAFVGGGLYDTGLPAVWAQGDYDYNGIVDLDDVIAFVGGGLYDKGPYNTGIEPGSLATLIRGNALPMSFDGGADPKLLAGGMTAVPEPSAGMLLALAVGGLVAYNRRRRICG
jgi:fibronectin-binding autotransporter adhesin